MPNRADRTISGPPEYLTNYSRFQPAYYIQDVTLSPDFPSVAQVMGELYEQTTGHHVDGVIAADPFGLADLLTFTGPVSINGRKEKLTRENAADYLTRQQYLDFDVAEGQSDEIERRDALSEVGRETFDQLVNGQHARAHDGSATCSVPRSRSATSWRTASDPEEEDFFSALGATGRLEPPGDHDAFMLITQNKGNNKIDSYLNRSINYTATLDPSTGELDATAVITLRNDAPASGLPLAIIGNNDQGLPLGTNAMFFEFYSPHLLREATRRRRPCRDGSAQGGRVPRVLEVPAARAGPGDDRSARPHGRATTGRLSTPSTSGINRSSIPTACRLVSSSSAAGTSRAPPVRACGPAPRKCSSRSSRAARNRCSPR